MSKLEKYDFRVQLNRHIMTLILISAKYDIDIEHLLNIHDEMKSDVFFFFYMMAGQKVNFPPLPTLEKLIELGNDLEDMNNDFSKYGETIEEIMKEIYDSKTNEIIIEANVTNEKFSRIFKQSKKLRLSTRKSGKSDEPDNQEINED